MRAPAWLGGLLAGELVVALMTEARGAVNEKAKRELGGRPATRAGGMASRTGRKRRGRSCRVSRRRDYAEYRPLMFSIAYRMTGTVGDAEDIVQDAFLRLTRVLRDGARIDSPKAYLATATTRLAISHLSSARVRRESYVGAWLPEPLVADPARPAERAEMSDSLSMAFLVLLESLSPTERAVFLLHEVFGYDYAEIADIIGKSEANCRQIPARARRHSTPASPGSTLPGSSARRWPAVSSTPRKAVICAHCWSCSPRMWS